MVVEYQDLTAVVECVSSEPDTLGPMCQHQLVNSEPSSSSAAPAAPSPAAIGEVYSRGDRRRSDIQRAAIEQFAALGIAKTSMGQIAAAAGVSRPALYQYFANKESIFEAAFIGLFDDLVTAALAALDVAGSTFERLDGFLQRYEGDLWEATAASAHVDEITQAKNERIALAVRNVVSRLELGLESALRSAAPGCSDADVASWLQLLRLAPAGLRQGQPSVSSFRARLTSLARAVAAEVDSVG